MYFFVYQILFDKLVKIPEKQFLSFPPRIVVRDKFQRESSLFKVVIISWIPAFAGMTTFTNASLNDYFFAM